MDIRESVLLERICETLVVMRGAIDFGLTGIRSTGGLAGWRTAAEKLPFSPRKYHTARTLGSESGGICVGGKRGQCSHGANLCRSYSGFKRRTSAVLFALAEERFTTEDLSVSLVAGAIGMSRLQSILSGAEGGCQAEYGSAAAVAAGTRVDLLGGSPVRVGHAVCFALKNLLGLVCDPVAGLVECPASNATPVLP